MGSGLVLGLGPESGLGVTAMNEHTYAVLQYIVISFGSNRAPIPHPAPNSHLLLSLTVRPSRALPMTNQEWMSLLSVADSVFGLVGFG